MSHSALIPPLALRDEDAARLYGMGRTAFRQADKLGQVPQSFTIGGAKLWSVEEIRAHIAHGCPPRARWSEIWKALREKSGQTLQIGFAEPVGNNLNSEGHHCLCKSGGRS